MYICLEVQNIYVIKSILKKTNDKKTSIAIGLNEEYNTDAYKSFCDLQAFTLQTVQI